MERDLAARRQADPLTPVEIRQLAADTGIALEYQDARGVIVSTGLAALLKLLQNIGVVDADGEAVELQPTQRTVEVFPPAMVVRADKGRVAIDLDGVPHGVRLGWRLTLESGKTRRGEADFSRKSAEGARRQLVLSDIPYGYHVLQLDDPPARTLLIVTPGRCWLPENFSRGERSFGISLQLYLLRSARNWGIGDFTDLAQLAVLAARHGCDVLGLNPLHQMFTDNPEHASPYSPLSRRFLNILYIDVEAIAEFEHSAKARALVGSGAFQAALQRCRDAADVDYTGVTDLKLRVLRLLHAEFRANAPAARRAHYLAFTEDAGEILHDTSLFQVLRDHFSRIDPARAAWQSWPEDFRAPGSATVRQFAARYADEVDFYDWTQWIADQQLAAANAAAERAGMRIGLYRDLAVGSDRTGAETWASPVDFIASTDVGAPPDILNPAGQNWGLPPFNPVALRAQAYAPFIALLRANMRHAGGVRIDHVMGLQRLYCIPAGSREGGFITYPIADLVGILALESHRHRCLVVGEDLGTVPEGFRERMAEANVLSYRVLFFEHDEVSGAYLPPSDYPRLAVAVAGSHDMPTLRGWLVAHDVDLKHRLGLYPSVEESALQRALRDRQRADVLAALQLPAAAPVSDAEFSDAVHRFLGGTESVLAITQLDDLLDEQMPVNVPGTSTEHPNWRRKYSHPLESLEDDHRAWQTLQTLAGARRS